MKSWGQILRNFIKSRVVIDIYISLWSYTKMGARDRWVPGSSCQIGLGYAMTINKGTLSQTRHEAIITKVSSEHHTWTLTHTHTMISHTYITYHIYTHKKKIKKRKLKTLGKCFPVTNINSFKEGEASVIKMFYLEQSCWLKWMLMA